MRWCALLLPFAVASCSLFLDTGTFAGGGETDAGGGAGDAAGDAPSSTSDADADGGTGAETSTTNGCGTPDFRDSFDDGDLGAKWDGLNQSGGTLTLDKNDAVSAPNALLATVVNTGTNITLTKGFSGTKHVCCEMAMRGSVVSTTIARFLGGSEGLTLTLSLADNNTTTLTETLYFGNNDPENANGVIGTFSAPGSAWRKLRIDLTIDRAKNPVRIYVDGTLALTGSVNIGTRDLSYEKLVLGVPYTQSNTGGTIRYDDVACTFK